MTAAATVRVDGLTRDILSTAEVNGLYVTVPARIGPREWDRVTAVLTGLGGEWVRGRGYRFPTDPGPLLAGVLAGAGVPAPARITEGYIRTPERLARRLVTDFIGLAAQSGPVTVLEPSAGNGALVRAVLAADPDAQVTAVEPNPDRARQINADGRHVDVRVSTLEEHLASCEDTYELVVMNPPFAVPSRPVIWIEHVRAAWDRVRPGGRLVAIVPNGFTWRVDSQHTRMRQSIQELGGHEVLPAGAFTESGTDIKAAVIWADKPIDGRPPYLPRSYTGLEVPVQVKDPQLYRGAPPVQVWDGSFSGRRGLVLRLLGRCVVCPRLVWGFSNGDNDPRGALGAHTVAYLDPMEEDMVGPVVIMCADCHGERGWERQHAGLEVARRLWTPDPALAGGEDPEPPAVETAANDDADGQLTLFGAM